MNQKLETAKLTVNVRRRQREHAWDAKAVVSAEGAAGLSRAGTREAALDVVRVSERVCAPQEAVDEEPAQRRRN